MSYCENVHDMYGKPIKDLSAFELKLLTYARTFLSIFKNATKEIPNHVAKDPELLLDFHCVLLETGTIAETTDGDYDGSLAAPI